MALPELIKVRPEYVVIFAMYTHVRRMNLHPAYCSPASSRVST